MLNCDSSKYVVLNSKQRHHLAEMLLLPHDAINWCVHNFKTNCYIYNHSQRLKYTSFLETYRSSRQKYIEKEELIGMIS